MKKIVSICLLLFLFQYSFAGCDYSREVNGSGEVITLQKDITDFTKLEITSTFTATVTRSEFYSVQLRLDDNLVGYLDVEKNGDVLTIDLVDTFSYRDVTLEADITLPDLEALSISGASSAVVSGFDFEHPFVCYVSGASAATGSMNTGLTDFNISGASSVELEGYGGDLTINGGGASTLSLGHFISDNADITLSGGARTTVNITGTIDAVLSGGSILYYYGDPIIGDTALSGNSKIEKIE